MVVTLHRERSDFGDCHRRCALRRQRGGTSAC